MINYNLALPCLALPCLALPCLALPCLALPCLALPCLTCCLHFSFTDCIISILYGFCLASYMVFDHKRCFKKLNNGLLEKQGSHKIFKIVVVKIKFEITVFKIIFLLKLIPRNNCEKF
jgi:hypothetical protein